MLRALPVDADRDGIADALAAACLEFDDVERVQVVFLPEDGSTPFPSSVMSSLLETRMPVAIAGGDGSRP
ncbi:PAS domain S-box protein, partial [Rhizobium ruizarguesonis]